MRRLTCWARKDDSSGEWRVNENGTEYTGPHVDRLAEIENILCDDEYEKEYDLDRLRVMMQQRLSLRDEVAERFHLTKNIPLDRLRELITADRDKRCVILPVKPGGTVRFSKKPKAKCETVDAIIIYPDGKINFGFHEYGMKTEWVDRWTEDVSENYDVLAKDKTNATKGERE